MLPDGNSVNPCGKLLSLPDFNRYSNTIPEAFTACTDNVLVEPLTMVPNGLGTNARAAADAGVSQVISVSIGPCTVNEKSAQTLLMSGDPA